MFAILLQDVKSFVSCQHSPEESVFTVVAPPDAGYYKLEIYAARTPNKKEKVLMPIGTALRFNTFHSLIAKITSHLSKIPFLFSFVNFQIYS
jgi:hypothetical protein